MNSLLEFTPEHTIFCVKGIDPEPVKPKTDWIIPFSSIKLVNNGEKSTINQIRILTIL